MRDDQINRMHELNVRRSMLLLRQFEFLQTRFQAYEHVLSKPTNMLRAIWSPSWLKMMVDRRQQELLRKRNQEMEEVIAKPKIITATNGNGHV